MNDYNLNTHVYNPVTRLYKTLDTTGEHGFPSIHKHRDLLSMYPKGKLIYYICISDISFYILLIMLLLLYICSSRAYSVGEIHV